MDSTTIEHYRKLRADNPFMPADAVLNWAKTHSDASEGWDDRSHDNWEREVEGFTIRLHVEQESIFPVPDRHGNTDYGTYVEQVGRYAEDYEWDGQWSRPTEEAPLGIPYTAIRYSGPGWVQGEQGGYFIPDGIEDQFTYFRQRGQSKAVAWTLTREWVESQISMLFHSPLTNCVVRVSAWRESVELASTSMGTDVSGDDEGRDYIFTMVEEHGMVEEVIQEAREVIERLSATEKEIA